MARSAAPSSSSPWASLPGDLVQLIAWRVLAGDLLGYVRFRAVCTSWRSGTVRPRGRGVTDHRFHPRSWTMIAKGHPCHCKPVRFLNLDTGIFVRLKLPLFRNHHALDSVDGLLLLLRDKDTAVRLLNPFTGDIAELPPLATLLTQTQEWFSVIYNIRATVSCNAAAAAGITTSNDQQWTMATWTFPLNVENLSFRGSLYLVHNPTPTVSQIFRIDVGSPQPSPPRLVATCPPDIRRFSHYLVDCDSEILVVGNSNVSFSRILVYKLADLMLGRFTPVTSIGERALFMEERTTMCVSSNNIIPAETLIYTDKKTESRGYYAQYHLLTDTWSQPIDGYDIEGPPGFIYHAMAWSMCNVWNKRWLASSVLEYPIPKRGRLLWKIKRLFHYWF